MRKAVVKTGRARNNARFILGLVMCAAFLMTLWGFMRLVFTQSQTVERADLIGPTGFVVFTISLGVMAMTPDDPD